MSWVVQSAAAATPGSDAVLKGSRGVGLGVVFSADGNDSLRGNPLQRRKTFWSKVLEPTGPDRTGRPHGGVGH